MGYNMITKNGHNFFEMAAMLQNAIRRADYQRAGYAANEMFPKYRGYLWRRLLIISAEDCYGIMTKEIVALKQAEEMMKNGGSDETFSCQRQSPFFAMPGRTAMQTTSLAI